jgi:DNA-binding NtrC family response regulator
MMQPRRSVLLVAPSPRVMTSLFAWLSEAECDVTVATSFADAKAQLEQGPSLLITEVRLGDYNGLHLVIRAQAHSIPAFVLGDPDLVLHREAERLGAVYLTYDLDRPHLLHLLERLAPGVTATSFPTESNVSFVSWSEVAPPIHLSDETWLAPKRHRRPS